MFHVNVIQNERQKWTNKENWISSSLLARLQGKIMFNWTNNHLGFSVSLLNRQLTSGLNEFAEDARGLVVVTHGLAVVALKTISTKKSAISYLQTCSINLVFLSLVYSSTNKGKTIGNPGSLCVTRDITQVNYREHMRRSLGLKICWEMEIKIVETYHVASFCCP